MIGYYKMGIVDPRAPYIWVVDIYSANGALTQEEMFYSYNETEAYACYLHTMGYEDKSDELETL